MKVYKLSDEVLGRIINILQEAMISGVDILDLFRMMQLTQSDEDENELTLTSDYRDSIKKWHDEITKMLEKRQEQFSDSHGGILVGTGQTNECGGVCSCECDCESKKVN